MKKSGAAIALISTVLLAGCSDESFVKVFKCPEDKPYLNTVNNRCYTSAEAAEEVNKLIKTDQEEAAKKIESASPQEIDADALDEV